MAYPGPVTDDENLTRFVTKHSQIKEGGRVHHSVFCPSEKHSYTTSVYRTDDLNRDEIWDLADANITMSVLAETTIKTQAVYENNLDLDPDDIPPRHANIINWPQDRKQYRSIAQKLAAKANHNIR